MIKIELIDGGHFGDEKALLQLARIAEYGALINDKVKAKPLRRKEAKQAGRTLWEAAQEDPVFRYVQDTPDARNTRFSRRVTRLQQTLSARLWAVKKIGLAVDHGHAVVCASLPPEEEERKKRSIPQKFIIDLYARIIKLTRVATSKEQRRRLEEVEAKLDRFAADHLGEAFRSMRCVNALATHPDFQRRGYGGALVDAVTSLADAEGRSTYLFSSNPINTEFYNSHGFFTLAELLVGEDEPTWKKPPVPIALMVRIHGES